MLALAGLSQGDKSEPLFIFKAAERIFMHEAVISLCFLFTAGIFSWGLYWNRRFKRKEKSLTLFYASLAHELKTPLNAILGFSELLQLDDLSEKERIEFARNIRSGSEILLHMINQILDSAKLDAGEMILSPEATNFPAFLSELNTFILPLLKGKDLHFEIKSGSIPSILRVDSLQIRQILLNLIGNAIKFSDHGTITLRADFENSSEQHGTLHLCVSDQGPGIPEGQQKKIFEPFRQYATESKRNLGCGLGLSITAKIIHRMNGQIRLETEVGKGSSFHVFLPDIIAESTGKSAEHCCKNI